MTERKLNLHNLPGISNLPKVSWTWAEGEYWDMWMVVHLLAGALFGIFFELLQSGFFLGFFSSVAVLIAWEMVAVKKLDIRESAENRIIDAIVALCGFGLAYVLAIPANPGATITVGLVIVAVVAFMDYKGWQSYMERKGVGRVKLPASVETTKA